MENRFRVVGGSDVGDGAAGQHDSRGEFLNDFDPTGKAYFLTWFAIALMGMACVVIGFLAASAWARVYPL